VFLRRGTSASGLGWNQFFRGLDAMELLTPLAKSLAACSSRYGWMSGRSAICFRKWAVQYSLLCCCICWSSSCSGVPAAQSRVVRLVGRRFDAAAKAAAARAAYWASWRRMASPKVYSATDQGRLRGSRLVDPDRRDETRAMRGQQGLGFSLPTVGFAKDGAPQVRASLGEKQIL